MVLKQFTQCEGPSRHHAHTNMGDIITIQLLPGGCPKTVENFVTLAKRAIIMAFIFHRVIKDFMIQAVTPPAPVRAVRASTALSSRMSAARSCTISAAR